DVVIARVDRPNSPDSGKPGNRLLRDVLEVAADEYDRHRVVERELTHGERVDVAVRRRVPAGHLPRGCVEGREVVAALRPDLLERPPGVEHAGIGTAVRERERPHAASVAGRALRRTRE